MARITLMGWYRYDKSLFNGLILPDGMSSEKLISRILMRSGDRFTVWQSPQYIKDNIANWSAIWVDSWSKMWEALNLEYNPLTSYWKDSTKDDKPNLTTNLNRNSENTSDSNSKDNIETSDTNVNENTKSAFNSDSYQPREKDSGNSTGKRNETINNSSSSSSNSSENKHESGNRFIEEHIKGSSGVYSPAQLLEKELEVRKNNLYEFIAKQFEEEFLILLY